MWTTTIATHSRGRMLGSARQRTIPFALEIAGTVVVLLLPILLSGSPLALRLALNIAILAVLSLSLTLIFGFTGQISLGQAAFYAVGAYVSAALQVNLGVPFPVAWLVAIVMSMLVAYLVSLPLLRISGHFLALGTLALGLIAYVILVQWLPVTGGTSGILIPLGTYVPVFATTFPFVIVVTFCLAYWLVRNLSRRSLGRALFALRDDPAGAAALGIPVTRYKTIVFAVGGGLAGAAGILYSHYVQVITPEVFAFDHSMEVLLVVVIGGMSSRFGAILGSAVVILIPQWLAFLQEGRNIVYGVLVLVVLLFLPGGIAGGLTSLGRLVAGAIRRRRERGEVAL